MPDIEDLNLEVRDGDIIVTQPGTDYAITYRKVPGLPGLTMTESWLDINPTTPAVAEFRARAWMLANAKARGLGWIV
jgi:hypothetical protein